VNTAAATASADDDLATQNKTLACSSTCSGQRNSENQKDSEDKNTYGHLREISLSSVRGFLFVCLSPVAFGLVPNTKTRRLQMTYHLKPLSLPPRSQNLQGRRRTPQISR
jgi:hypothetical protein